VLAKQKFLLLCGVVACLALLCPALASATPVDLGDAESFAVLAGTTITNTGATTIIGDVGVSPGTSITGQETINLTGSYYTAGAALAAKNALTVAYTDLAGRAATQTLSTNLGGLIVTPGVYTVPAGTTNLSGTLTLDGQGDPDAVWVFQMPSTLITSPNAVVNVINTGAGAGVYWLVGSSATLDTDTSFEGNILALTSITLNAGADILNGRALAREGAVTMINNTINAVPIPPTVLLLGSGLIGLWASRLRKGAKKA
jgi:hypothetical protein